jgi:uncharacterized protein YkwD
MNIGPPRATGQATASATAPRRRGEDSRIERAVRRQINVVRAARGLPRVHYGPTLDRAAEAHTRHMASTGRFAHEGIGDGTAADRVRRAGFRRGWGEVLARGNAPARDIVRGWMNSPAHRAILVDRRYDHVGVANKVGVDGRQYFAAVFGDATSRR